MIQSAASTPKARHLDNIDIPIRRGLRQGALTSPMLFNIFYRQLTDTHSRHDAGVIIDNHKYNVFTMRTMRCWRQPQSVGYKAS